MRLNISLTLLILLLAGCDAPPERTAFKATIDSDTARIALREELAQKRKLREQEVLAKVKAANPDSHHALMLHYAELEKLDPENATYSAAWKRHKTAYDRIADIQRKKLEVEDRAKRRTEGVRIGMSKRDVLMSNWGKPRKINSTTTAAGTSEQWVYDGGYLYFGENGLLKGIQN